MIKTLFIKLLILLILFIFGNAVVYGNPIIDAISGQIKHDSDLTILGIGFGSKVRATPIRWDDFEGFRVGQSIGEATSWYIDGKNGLKIESENQRHNNSYMNVKAFASPSGTTTAYKNDVGFRKTKKILISLWIRWDWGKNIIDSDSRYQIKAWRVASRIEPSGAVHYPDFANFNWKYTEGNEKHYISQHRAPNSNTKYFLDNILVTGQWHHMMLVGYMGTEGNSNGSWEAWCSAYPISNGYSKITQNNVMVIGSGDDYIDAIKFDNWLGNLESGTANLYYDDIYIDNTWARVEIGDKKEYDLCNHREMQIPKEWTDRSITITLNQGSFINGKPLYLYAVDEDGNVNRYGYPIIFGDGAYVKPSPPSSGGDVEISPPKRIRIMPVYDEGS